MAPPARKSRLTYAEPGRLYSTTGCIGTAGLARGLNFGIPEG